MAPRKKAYTHTKKRNTPGSVGAGGEDPLDRPPPPPIPFLDIVFSNEKPLCAHEVGLSVETALAKLQQEHGDHTFFKVTMHLIPIGPSGNPEWLIDKEGYRVKQHVIPAYTLGPDEQDFYHPNAGESYDESQAATPKPGNNPGRQQECKDSYSQSKPRSPRPRG